MTRHTPARPARLLLLPVLLASLLSAACTPVAVPQPQQAAPRLYLFDCGSITFSDISAFGLSNSDTDVRQLFVPCYLVVHPQGTLFWDGGLPLALAGQGAVEPEPGMTLRYDRSVLEQLAEIGYRPDDITWLALSHLHFDHVGATAALTSAHLLIQQPEYQAALVEHQDYPVFEPSHYSTLANNPRTLLNGDHDVFGDGSVMILLAPGHTPGHQTLLVNLVNTGPVLLSGDLYHFRFNRTHQRVPVFNTNAEQSRASMVRMETLLKDRGATLWLEHDQAQANTLAKAPAFHD